MRNLIQACLGRVGLKLIRDPGPAGASRGLLRLSDAGMAPSVVFDVGAAFGDWSTVCAEVFSDALFVLLEPVDEYRAILESSAARIPQAVILSSAASDVSGTTAFNVHPDYVGSSLLRETEGGNVDGVPRVVKTVRLDDVASARSLEGPYLLKIDVQGAELQVLRGAERVLQETLAVCLEVSFMEFFVGGATFSDIIDFMAQRGFVVFDIYGLMRRPSDDALAQADLLFVRKGAAVRSTYGFATPEQRCAQDAMFRDQFERRSAQSARHSSNWHSDGDGVSVITGVDSGGQAG